jgi:hypothetical protein
MEKRVRSWYKTLDGQTFLIHGRKAGTPHICPCHCHQEPFAGVKIFVSCSHCQPEQQGGGLRDIETKLENIVKTVAHNAHLPDQEKLVAWATAKLKEVMAEYVQELQTAEKEENKNSSMVY